MRIKLPKEPLAPHFVAVTDIDSNRTRFINLAHAKMIDYCPVAGFPGVVPCIVLADDKSLPVWAKAEIAALAKAIGTTAEELMKPPKKSNR